MPGGGSDTINGDCLELVTPPFHFSFFLLFKLKKIFFGHTAPAPVFLPGESQGWGSLVGCCLWGRTESDTTEAT